MSRTDTPVLVIDDCSTDGTRAAARAAGAELLCLPHHLGLGGAVQAGYKLAFELGLGTSSAWMATASMMLPISRTSLKRSGPPAAKWSSDRASSEAPAGRRASRGRWASDSFAQCFAPVLGKHVHNPTSGFVGVNRRALEVFSRSFPLEYPEIEALVVLQRRRFRFQEVPCKMYARVAGRSSITKLKSLYYIAHVLLGVFMNVLKYERRRRRE